MARIKIFRKDGSPTPYFWSDKNAAAKSLQTVYKQTEKGVTRMKGVRYEPATGRMHRD
ncbi:MAG TPA: hypothetical protein VFU06_00415 [Longimicrobiales bacterium]|nr:hypothetical protein [Longimicrobiales bacterium]